MASRYSTDRGNRYGSLALATSGSRGEQGHTADAITSLRCLRCPRAAGLLAPLLEDGDATNAGQLGLWQSAPLNHLLQFALVGTDKHWQHEELDAGRVQQRPGGEPRPLVTCMI